MTLPPSPAPLPLPPLYRDQRKVDVDHLRVLAVFHFIFAGLAVLGLGFLFLHYTFMHVMLSNPRMMEQAKGAPPVEEFFAIFRWFYAIFGVLLLLGAFGNLLGGIFLRQHRCRLFSLIVAGLNCLQIPFGTALGAFTFIVLLRDSVRELYEATEQGQR